MRYRKALLIFSGLLVWMVSTALAQVTTGTILGYVVDQSGAAIPGVHVIVADSATGFQREAVTGGDGSYVVESLKPADYKITATKESFKEAVIQNVILQVAQRARINITLQVGSVNERVEVTAQAPVIQTDQASVGTVINSTQVLELPLNGRGFIQLATLSPGVYSSGGSVTGGSVTANGMSNESNNLMIDGVLNWETGINRQNFSPSVDLIQEFKIQTNSYDAEYGLSGGAQISVTTKRGTNSYHGSGFYFARNDALDARPYFQRTALPPFSQKEFGGSLGGRIPKSKKDFFFFNYEGFRQTQGLTIVRTFPTDILKNGDFSTVSTIIYDPTTLNPTTGKRQPFTGNIIPSNRISPVTKFFMRFWPSVPAGSPLVNNYVANPTQTQDSNQYSIRYDRDFSEKDMLTFRYTYNQTPVNLPLGNNGGATGVPGLGEVGSFNGSNDKLGWTHLFSPTMLNALNMGFSRFLQARQNQTTGTDFIAQAGMTGITRATDGIPTFNVSGWTQIADNIVSPIDQAFNNYTIDDVLTTVRGKHSFKFGGGFVYNRVSSVLSQFTRPTFSFAPRYTTSAIGATGDQFNALADFLLGDTGSVSITNNHKVQDWRSSWVSAFAQDNWTVSRSLTLTYGVRYEIYSSPYDTQGRASAIDLATGKFVFGQSVPTLPGTPPNAVTGVSLGYPRNRLQFPTRYDHFAPRLGFAYRMFGGDKWVLRGGFGVFYNWITTQVATALGQGAPFAPNISIGCNADVPCVNIANPLVTTIITPTTSGAAASKTNTAPYVEQYSLGLSHQFSPTLGFELSYVGNAGRHNLFNINLNQPAPGPGPVTPRLPYPQFSSLVSPLTVGTSNYNAMQVSARKTYDRVGLVFLGGYTWSHALGTAVSGPEFADQQPIRDVRNLGAEYGPTRYDRRHIFTLSWVYELPWGNGKPWAGNAGGALNQIIGGWKFGGISALRTGAYLTPSDIVDVSNAGGSRPNLICNPNNQSRPSRAAGIQQWFNKACFQRAQQFTFGNANVGSIVGPGYSDFDLSVYKDFAIGENKRLEFRAEFFNAFNHPNLSDPATAFGASSFGTISGTGPARQIQLGLRFDY
jgi:hypothetical protein